jgi:RNA polymerase sigma factor (sigma-70 family)
MTDPLRQERFLALLDEHKRILYKVAASYCRNPADRPDLEQEIVVQLWRSFGRYDERYRFSTWMYRIALNVAISFYRSETRRTRGAVPAEPAILETLETPEMTADGSGAAPDGGLELLHELIARLDELDRALVLLHLDGHGYDTISEILGISSSNVGTKLHRIRQRLKRDATETL